MSTRHKSQSPETLTVIRFSLVSPDSQHYNLPNIFRVFLISFLTFFLERSMSSHNILVSRQLFRVSKTRPAPPKHTWISSGRKKKLAIVSPNKLRDKIPALLLLFGHLRLLLRLRMPSGGWRNGAYLADPRKKIHRPAGCQVLPIEDRLLLSWFLMLLPRPFSLIFPFLYLELNTCRWSNSGKFFDKDGRRYK